jgi:hypothetical protein
MAPKTDLSGMKFLIATAAVTGTVGGWIFLAGSGGGTQRTVVRDPAIENLLNQPLPTLQPFNGPLIGPVVDPNAAAINQPATLPTLRKVVAPPSSGAAPGSVAVTRSSRK